MKRVIFFVFIALSLYSYAEIPVGSWRTHLSYSSVTQVAETPNRVYGVSDGGLFAYDKVEGSLDTYSKIDGLSDNKVVLIAYSPENNLLVIVYDNANIDLLTNDGTVYNIPDIKDKMMTADKSINEISFFGSNAYLSTGYGITIVNLLKHEISDSYLLNKITYSTALYKGKIFAATEKGVFGASLSSNLVDPNSWSKTHSLKANNLRVFQDSLVALDKNQGLFTLSDDVANRFYESNVLSGIVVAENTLVAYGHWQVSYFSSIASETSVSVTDLYGLSTLSPANGTWIATNTFGINKIVKTTDGYQKVDLTLRPNGPLANSPYKLKFSGNKLMVVGGGAWDIRFYTKGLLMFFENEKWTSINTDTIVMDNGVRDFVDVVEDPRELNHYFVSSYGEGVYEFRNQKLVKIHDHTNSGIETHALVGGLPHYDRTYGLCYDKLNNLYVTNMHVTNTIKILTKDGAWTSMNHLKYNPIANKECVFGIMQTRRGIFWVLNTQVEQGIFVFNPQTTLANQNDDQVNFLSTLKYLDNLEERTLKPDFFFCAEEDKNGAIWVGTEMGPVVFNSPSKIFNADVTCSRIKVPRNDGTQLADYLLEGERIKTIAIDGGNRKWIGTESNGVYLVSDNGIETIHHFTAENSPLLSNKILSIAIHPTTGEVFMGTDKGLVSYRSDAIEGKKTYSDVHAFPNPVRPEYEGLITITGLKAASTVRITDLVGNSLFEGTSEGGQITWNRKNRSGERVSTGVYLVYAALSDALEGVVTKILVVK
jgi:hypothetical protein